MSKTESYTTDKILKNIDAFIEGRPGEISDIQPYANLVNEYPFTSGKLKAKIANRFVHPQIKVIKKAFSGYFWQKDRQFILTQERLTEIEDKLDYLQKTIEQVLITKSDKNDRKVK